MSPKPQFHLSPDIVPRGSVCGLHNSTMPAYTQIGVPPGSSGGMVQDSITRRLFSILCKIPKTPKGIERKFTSAARISLVLKSSSGEPFSASVD